MVSDIQKSSTIGIVTRITPMRKSNTRHPFSFLFFSIYFLIYVYCVQCMVLGVENQVFFCLQLMLFILG